MKHIPAELKHVTPFSDIDCVFQAGVEDFRRQRQEDQERIRALEKQLTAMDAQYRQVLDGPQHEVMRSKGCCDTVSDLQDRITDAERKISSASENFDLLQNRLDKGISGGGGSSSTDENRGHQGGSLADAGTGGVGRGMVVTEDRLDIRLKDVELRFNNTVQQTEFSCSYLENNLKDYFHRELEDLRRVFLDRFNDQASRITAMELEVGVREGKLNDQDKRLSKMENGTFVLNQRLDGCNCSPPEGGTGGSPAPGDRGHGTGGATVGGTQGDLSVTGGENTEKSLEWRVVSNEDHIRLFNTQLKDLSVSGDSLHDKVRQRRHLQAQNWTEEPHHTRPHHITPIRPVLQI